MSDTNLALPSSLNAALVLADGKVFWGAALGASHIAIGEICFNTALTGYQETLTDSSYQGQIITFTFPHIGNVGCNAEDIESADLPVHGACGLVVREPITEPSNFRATSRLNDWLIKRGVAGISGLDTRALTRYIRMHGAQNAAIVSSKNQELRAKVQEAKKTLVTYPSLKGMELARTVTTEKPYEWTEPRWSLNSYHLPLTTSCHVVTIDYGIKLNILRSLISYGCRVTVVPATTSASEILALKPDGVFLSNGPGDPAATGVYALPIIKELIASGVPIFGICLGHQLLGIAMGGKTEKMKQGHRGVNHPVKNLLTGKVEITSQNHGFVVSEDLPEDVEVTHRSLFDGTIQGLRHKTKPIFCVQGHPESSPGPHDSRYLFEQFVDLMKDTGFRSQDSGKKAL